MRGTNHRKWNLLLAGLVLAAAACTGNSLDDGDSANVVLEVFNIPQIPPVTAAIDAASGNCLFTLTNVIVTLQNKPKSELGASSPFNDVVLQNVTLSYAWDSPSLTTPTRTATLGGTIPAGGTGTVSFPPIAGGDLSTANSGHSASVTMVFVGQTISGDGVQARGGGVLFVNSCATCGGDTDLDNVCDNIDNCPGVYNPTQTDSDNDGVGNACDPTP